MRLVIFGKAKDVFARVRRMMLEEILAEWVLLDTIVEHLEIVIEKGRN